MPIKPAISAKVYWDEANAPKQQTPPKKRPAPFSIRLSDGERTLLEAEADGIPLGAYIKEKVLGTAPARRLRRTGLSIQDRAALAQILAVLGGSEIAVRLEQLNYYASIGSLPLTPEIQAQLIGAIRDVRLLRALLIRALGMQPESE